jgi:hypothetical protein
MPEYRFYLMDKRGHIDRPPVTQDLPDDDAARAEAKQLDDDHAVEIWQGARIVAHLDPKK